MQYLYVACYPLERIIHPKNQDIDQKKISDSIMGDSDISVDLVIHCTKIVPLVTGY